MKKIEQALIILLILSLGGCKMADVRTEYMLSNQHNEDNHAKGKRLLEESVKAMGYDNLANIDSYSAIARFDWKLPWSAMPLNSLPGAKGNDIRFKFKANSFDGQVEYLEGRKKSDVHGLQSWQTYAYKDGGKPAFTKDKRRSWGLASYHYMLEGPYRLTKADVITYAGSRKFEGKDYDLVFVSWQQATPHKEHDQWLLYINKDTHFVDLANLTIRDFFMPFPPNMAEGTVRYLKREKTSEGIYFPKDLVIQLMAPKKVKKHVYRIAFKDFTFDRSPSKQLSPFENLEDFGDSKPSETR